MSLLTADLSSVLILLLEAAGQNLILRFSAEYYDVTVQLTFDLLDIK